MKQLVIGLMVMACCPCYLSFGQQKSPYFTDQDSIFIQGKINDFEPADGNGFISFLIFDLTGKSKKQSCQIAPDGSFKTVLQQSFSGDITVNYKSAFASMLTIPGAHLQLQVENSKIKAGSSQKGTFWSTGELAEVNNLLFNYQSALYNHTFIQEANLGDKQLTDSAFGSLRMIKLKEELQFLDAYMKHSETQNEQFKSWQRNQHLYEAGKDILLFPFFGKTNKTISESQLLKLIEKVPITNASAVSNSAYYEFLNMLVMDYQIMININPSYADLKKQQGNNAIRIYLTQINPLASGITKEILHFNLFTSLLMPPMKKRNEALVADTYQTIIQDPYLTKELMKLIEDDFKPYQIISRIQDLKTSNDLKTRLLSVFENAKGTHIFIDFWGDWCAPCMQEMPTYPQIIEAFDENFIKFIFFSAKTDDNSVRKVKEKFKIKADFINLTNDEVAMMHDIFEFHTYPSHFVVNKEGFVVSNRAKKVEDIRQVLFKQNP